MTIEAPPSPAPTEIVSCADPHAEVVESLRWVRELLASGSARPDEIAICATSTESWDEHFLVLAASAELPIYFSHGVAALSTREGQACAALADVLLNGLSQDRVRRLLGHAAGRGPSLAQLPQNWASGLRPEAALFEIDQWRRALEEAVVRRGGGLDPMPTLMPIVELLAKGPLIAQEAGESFLGAAAKFLWTEALRRASPNALEFSCKSFGSWMRVIPGRPWCGAPASHLVGAPRPWVRLLGLTSQSWPRRAAENPHLPDHILSRHRLDPDPITNRDRRAFELIISRASGGCVLSRSREEKIQRELNGGAFPTVPAQKSITLRPHQLAAAEAIFSAYKNGYPGFLLADDVGLGKTFAAWAAILRIVESSQEKWKILIVCPLGVVANWRSSIQWMGTNRGVEEVVILNYERLGKIFEAKPRKGAKKLSKRDLARRGAASEEFDIVLFDESHALKNLTSLRAKFSVKLYGSAKMIFWLSATAGQNPLQLGYLAPILAKKTGDWALTAKDFEQWCVDNLPGVSRGEFGAWAWAGGKEEEEKVHQLLFDPDTNGVKPALRRRASDLAGWPDVTASPIGSNVVSRQEAEAYFRIGSSPISAISS